MQLPKPLTPRDHLRAMQATISTMSQAQINAVAHMLGHEISSASRWTPENAVAEYARLIQQREETPHLIAG